MFLETWSLDEKQPELSRYLSLPVPPIQDCGGYVMPYGDDPMGTDRVGKRVYMDLLNRAEIWVDIMTPYMILDTELENSIKYAAARGVRVRIILPGIPDKKIAHALAKTHYPALLDAGVELYAYTPGFVHAKVFVCDGVEAVVGTINLDYRSLYHHFECATYLCGCPVIDDIETDFVQTLEQCRRVDARDLTRWRMLLGSLSKLAAPLL
jgi:cardiolipin synthase